MDCSFCSDRIPRGTEYLYVTSKGKIMYFCSSKCLKNQVKLKRKPRKVKWTETYREEKQGRLKLLGQKKEEPRKKPEPSKEPEQPVKKKEKKAKKAAKERSKPKGEAKKKAPAKEEPKEKKGDKKGGSKKKVKKKAAKK
ncbi:MAG: hypothetical protein GF416_01140 [Candidatus Altiarchaeales archaeon]|nr:hypothetical protein [Candidatus Altiarchaeales archaeon]MBD3415721.1 hypothetical protein [Candidatus Altiarchaeales archaeon]